jgi:hypothetical protein
MIKQKFPRIRLKMGFNVKKYIKIKLYVLKTLWKIQGVDLEATYS